MPPPRSENWTKLFLFPQIRTKAASFDRRFGTHLESAENILQGPNIDTKVGGSKKVASSHRLTYEEESAVDFFFCSKREKSHLKFWFLLHVDISPPIFIPLRRHVTE